MRKLETALIVILAAAPAYANGQTDPKAANTSASQQQTTGTTDNQQQADRMGESVFARWDENNDKRLEYSEFSDGLYQSWRGENDQLDQTAFDNNWDNWFDAERPTFSEIDDDGDGYLSPGEFRMAVNDANLRNDWQGAEDGYLTPEEFRNGLASRSDVDRNGKLDDQEMQGLITIVRVIVPEGTDTASNSDATAKSANDQTMAANGGSSSGQERVGQNEVKVGDVVPLNQWDVKSLYGSSWSAEALFDRTVHGQSGDEIGDVEDLIVGSNGQLVSLIAEVGGFWDIGDTHVSIPWDEVTFNDDGSVKIPVTEDNADNYSVAGRPTKQQLSNNVVSRLDDQAIGRRAWRASELIGDTARIRTGSDEKAATSDNRDNVNRAGTADNANATNAGRDRYTDYGYVEDLLFNKGKIVAAVIEAAPNGTTGRYAYPFYGYNYGWTPGQPTYDLPYTGDQAATLVPFDSDQL